MFPVDVKLGGPKERFRFSIQVGEAFLFIWSGSVLLSSSRSGGAVKETGIDPMQNMGEGALNPPHRPVPLLVELFGCGRNILATLMFGFCFKRVKRDRVR